MVMIYSFWNDEIRSRAARCKNVKPDDVTVDVLGDLRLLRHTILHNKGALAASQFARLKTMKELFEPDKEIILSHDGMHKLFIALKQGIAALIVGHAGPRPGTPEISQLVDVAIQRKE
jgi:hemin uptake protein HemP